MKRSTIITIIIAILLLVGGSVLMAIGIGNVVGDVDSILQTIPVVNHFVSGGEDVVTDTKEIHETVNAVRVEVGSADVTFVVSDDSTTRVTYTKAGQLDWTVAPENGTLVVKERAETGLFFGGFRQLKVTIAVPADITCINVDAGSGNVTVPEGFRLDQLELNLASGDADVKADVRQLTFDAASGNLLIDSANVGAVNFNAASGDLRMAGTAAGSLHANVFSGSVTLSNTLFTAAVEINSTSGDVEMKQCDADFITITATSGDVVLELLSGKQFRTRTTSGSANVPNSSGTAPCEITTTSGDIRVTLAGS